MASATSLRSRRSAAQLHALAGVEREIRANDHNGRRKYLLDFSRAFRAYESVLASEQLPELLQQADIILIGDYHALPASQRFAASLIEQAARDTERPVVLGLETVFSRDQHILDEWLRDEIMKRNCTSASGLTWTGATSGSPSLPSCAMLGSTRRRFMGWIACRARTCAKSGRVIATLPPRSPRYDSAILMPSSRSCLVNRTLLQTICRGSSMSD